MGILTFELPEQRAAFETAQNGAKYEHAFDRLDEELRRILMGDFDPLDNWPAQYELNERYPEESDIELPAYNAHVAEFFYRKFRAMLHETVDAEVTSKE